MASLYAQSINRLNKHGQRMGKWVTYIDDEKKIKLFEGTFKNGKPVGKSYFYNNDGLLDRREINRFKKLKTTFYYPNGIVRLSGRARMDNLPDKIHYYFYGKWKAYDETGTLIKYYYYKNGNLLRTVYLNNKHSKTNDSLIKLLNGIDAEFTAHRTTLADSINAHLKDPVKYVMFKRLLNVKDSLTFLQIDRVISTYGYPTQAIAGDASGIPFYILGFASIQLKEKYLDALKAAANKGDISWKSLAFFIDKLKMAKGEKQIYGTQYYLSKNGAHDYILYPVEDEAH